MRKDCLPMNSMPKWSVVSGSRVETGEGQGWERKGEHKQSYSYKQSFSARKHCVTSRIHMFTDRCFICCHMESEGICESVMTHGTRCRGTAHVDTLHCIQNDSEMMASLLCLIHDLDSILVYAFFFFFIILINERVLKVQIEIWRTGNIWMKC